MQVRVANTGWLRNANKSGKGIAQEAKAGGPRVQGWPGLQSKTLSKTTTKTKSKRQETQETSVGEDREKFKHLHLASKN